MEKQIQILKALTDLTRLRVISLLYQGELCVCDLEAIIDEPQTKISRHLACLKNAGLITGRKSAQWTYYSMKPDLNLKFLDELISGHLREQPPFKNDISALLKKKRGDGCGSAPVKKKEK
jgi:DNA-binding transcriptional ArsR family regulator